MEVLQTSPLTTWVRRRATGFDRRRLLVLTGGNELELSGEPVDDEVVAGAVDPAVRDRGEQNEHAEDERCSGSHPRLPFSPARAGSHLERRDARLPVAAV